MSIKELIIEKAEKTNLELKQKLQDLKRITLEEAWKSLQLVVASVVQIIEAIAQDLSGQDKKTIAIEYINSFYDRVFVIIDIPFVPRFVEPIIHRYIKMILMVMVSSTIDATVTIFKQTGIFLKKG